MGLGDRVLANLVVLPIRQNSSAEVTHVLNFSLLTGVCQCPFLALFYQADDVLFQFDICMNPYIEWETSLALRRTSRSG